MYGVLMMRILGVFSAFFGIEAIRYYLDVKQWKQRHADSLVI